MIGLALTVVLQVSSLGVVDGGVADCSRPAAFLMARYGGGFDCSVRQGVNLGNLFIADQRSTPYGSSAPSLASRSYSKRKTRLHPAYRPSAFRHNGFDNAGAGGSFW